MKVKFIILLIILVISGITLGYLAFKVRNKPDIQSTNRNSFEDYFDFNKDTKNSQESKTTFLATGDIMLSRSVAKKIQGNNKDGSWPFVNIKNLFAEADFAFGNLESPFSESDAFNPSGSLVFNAPRYTLTGLMSNKFKVLNLANNHALDQGLKALLYTKKLLDDNGIVNIGAAENQTQAWQGKIYNSNGINVGFIGASYTSLNDNGATKNAYVARMEDLNLLKKSIEELKTKSDYIIVTMHAGTEYTTQPNAEQIKFARAAIDYGADMVIGAHPHWVQTIENYNGQYIFYSLGNFIFDQEWSRETKEGLVLKIELSKPGSCDNSKQACSSTLQGGNIKASLKEVKLLPIIIENFGQPRLATDIEANKILNKIGVSNKILTP